MKNILFVILTFMVISLFGCSSGGNNPTTPSNQALQATVSNHQCWGLWQFTADPDKGTLDVVRLRSGEFHLNALPFLEPPPLLNLTLESLKFIGNIIEADIGLRHPFFGLTEFTGFDVCGILISNGSVTGFGDPDLRMAGPGDTRMLNPDGYTRWWNPAEFPAPGTIFGYKDGLLGTPDSVADFNSTLNPYKYYCDDLGPKTPLTAVNLAKRGMFSAGKKIIRHYRIDMGPALIFNYAVDASWQFPTGQKPWIAPDDFAPEANKVEPWNINVQEMENTLAYENGAAAGHLLLRIDVYDWFNADKNTVIAESLKGIPPVNSSTPVGGGPGYSTYELDLPGDSLTKNGNIDILITVQSDSSGYQELLPGKVISAYFNHTTNVSAVLPAGLIWVYDDEQQLIDSVHEDRTPSIHQRTTHDIDIGFTRLESLGEDKSRAQCHMMTSSNNGQSFIYAWKGNATHGGQTLKDLKVCQDPLGYSTFMYQSFRDWGQTMYQHASTARDPACPFGHNEGIYIPWTQHANEVIFAADNKVICMGDRDGRIMYKKGSDAYSLYYNGLWTGWWDCPDTIIVPSPAYISEVRSICKDASGAIHLAYFGGQNGVWIKMISNSDGLGTNWDKTVYITDGSSDEYAARIEPSLIIDPDGKFHATFVGVIGSVHAILYATSDNGVAWSGYKPIFTNPDGYLGLVTIDTFKFEDTTIIVISFEMDGDIWFISSIDGGETFLEPVLVSDGTSNSVEPDIRADAQGFVHFAWAQFKEELGYVDDYDIHYRRAYLEKE